MTIPANRFTIFAPKSQDPSEATVLTPIAGAAHADPFQVTTIQGVSGSKPYMDYPKGRQGTIDPLTKKLTTGNLTIRVFDPRTSTGNASRWATAFLGDATGVLRLIGCKWTLEESLDGGTTWRTTLTGRIHDFSLSDPQWIQFQCWDVAADLNRQVFTGAPHTSVTYAFPSALAPVGLPQPWGTGFAATAPLTGTISGRGTQTANGQAQSYGVLTVTVTDPWPAVITGPLAGAVTNNQPLFVKLTAGGQTGMFQWTNNRVRGFWTAGFQQDKVTHLRVGILDRLVEMPPTHPLYMAMPSNGTTVTFQIFADGAPTAQLPLFVGPVNPVRFLGDLIDGKFSLRASTDPLIAIAPRDTSTGGPWDTTSSGSRWRDLPDVFFAITGPSALNDFAQNQILQTWNIAWKIDANGKVVPVDLRRTANVTPIAVLTDADLDASTDPTWTPSRDQAITGAAVTYYIDRPVDASELKSSTDLLPAFPPSMVTTDTQTVFVANDLSTVRDIGEKIIKVDAKGLRVHATAVDSNGVQAAAQVVINRIAGLFQDALAPYAAGPAHIGLRCLRTANALAVTAGDWTSITCTKIPDPSSNTRGGTRLALCLSRTEDGEFLVFDFLDAGASGVAIAPSITSAVVASDDPNALDITVAHNASNDPIILYYAVTTTAVSTRPDEKSSLWSFGARVEGTTARISALPTGSRIWLRARSQTTGVAVKLPSVWIYPSSGFVDLSGVTAPSALAVTNNFANRQDLSWTVGDATKNVEIFRTPGTAPSTWTEALKIAVLDPASTAFRAFGTVATTQYTYGVRHRDAFGGPSSMATLTITSGGSLGVAPRPAGIDIAVVASV